MNPPNQASASGVDLSALRGLRDTVRAGPGIRGLDKSKDDDRDKTEKRSGV